MKARTIFGKVGRKLSPTARARAMLARRAYIKGAKEKEKR